MFHGIHIYSNHYRNFSQRAYMKFGVYFLWRNRLSVNPLRTVGDYFSDLLGISADVKVEGSQIPSGGPAVGGSQV